MHPQAIGFDVKNIKMTDELPNTLEILLNTMRLRFNDTLANSFQKYLMSSVLKYVPHLLDLCNIAQSNSCDKQIQHVNGLMILERCNLFDRSVPVNITGIDRFRYIQKLYIRTRGSWQLATSILATKLRLNLFLSSNNSLVNLFWSSKYYCFMI